VNYRVEEDRNSVTPRVGCDRVMFLNACAGFFENRHRVKRKTSPSRCSLKKGKNSSSWKRSVVAWEGRWKEKVFLRGLKRVDCWGGENVQSEVPIDLIGC
jgi:hypothetical protein